MVVGRGSIDLGIEVWEVRFTLFLCEVYVDYGSLCEILSF